jgi:hypothetical protein
MGPRWIDGAGKPRTFTAADATAHGGIGFLNGANGGKLSPASLLDGPALIEFKIFPERPMQNLEIWKDLP